MAKRTQSEPDLAPTTSAGADYPEHVHAAIQEILRTLADIEAAHESEVAALEKMGVPERQKQLVVAELESRRKERREPYALRLAELYGRLTFRAMFRTEH